MSLLDANMTTYGRMPDMLCCMCGVEIQYNAANMCVSCLTNQVNIADGLRTQLTIHSCRNCARCFHFYFFVMSIIHTK